jgi:hypothetical protein
MTTLQTILDGELAHVSGGIDILKPPGFSLSKHQRACIEKQPSSASIGDVANACLPAKRRNAYSDAVTDAQDRIDP